MTTKLGYSQMARPIVRGVPVPVRGTPEYPIQPAHGHVPTDKLEKPVDPLMSQACIDAAETFSDKRVLGNNGGLFFLHISIPAATATATPDIYFQLQRPSRFFLVVSITTGNSADNNAVFMSFKPTNKSYAGGAVQSNGTEEWFCLKSFNNAGSANTGQLLEIPEPVQDVYFTIGNEAGAGATPYFITIAYSPERFNFRPGMINNVG